MWTLAILRPGIRKHVHFSRRRRRIRIPRASTDHAARCNGGVDVLGARGSLISRSVSSRSSRGSRAYRAACRGAPGSGRLPRFALSSDRTFENPLTSILYVLASFARPSHVRPLSTDVHVAAIIAVGRARGAGTYAPRCAPRYRVDSPRIRLGPIRDAACLQNFPSLLRGLLARGHGRRAAGRGGGGGEGWERTNSIRSAIDQWNGIS